MRDDRAARRIQDIFASIGDQHAEPNWTASLGASIGQQSQRQEYYNPVKTVSPCIKHELLYMSHTIPAASVHTITRIFPSRNEAMASFLYSGV